MLYFWINNCRNPLIESWLRASGSTEKPDETPENVPVPESSQRLLETLKAELNLILDNPLTIEFDLRKPYPNPKLSMEMKNPKTAKLGEVI